jgi:2-C-methyl-D-erythritol 4-phosphate cytidylyltransferase
MAASGHMTVAAIVVAAGDGRRLGAEVPKAFVPMFQQRPMLAGAVCLMRAHPDVRDVVIVAPAGWTDAVSVLAPDALVVAGGAQRQQSVQRGLAALRPDVDAVLVHDAARPFVPAAVIDRVIAALVAGAPAVVPVMPLADTVKRVSADGVVTATLVRAELRAVQTPQGFRRDVLTAAHTDAPADALDDASLVERLGIAVLVVDGDENSYKITTRYDLERAVDHIRRTAAIR